MCSSADVSWSSLSAREMSRERLGDRQGISYQPEARARDAAALARASGWYDMPCRSPKRSRDISRALNEDQETSALEHIFAALGVLVQTILHMEAFEDEFRDARHERS